jgi:uncharacterized membrane protein (UPF0127 family)
MPWLVRDGEVLASAETAATRATRRRGLLGRGSLEGVLVIRPCRQVHSLGMAFPLDVIWCDRNGRVLRIAALPPKRVSRLVPRSRFVVETEHGNAARWGLRVGDILEVAASAGP